MNLVCWRATPLRTLNTLQNRSRLPLIHRTDNPIATKFCDFSLTMNGAIAGLARSRTRCLDRGCRAGPHYKRGDEMRTLLYAANVCFSHEVKGTVLCIKLLST
jgi:hypothetical protein